MLAQEDFHEFALGYCNGTTVVHMSAKAFEDYRLPAVTREEAAPVASALSALNAQDACMAEVADLTRTRDELLPLLMSGRVRVADAWRPMAGLSIPTEDALEQWVLEILAELGWTPLHGPDIAPDEPAAERSDYRETVLEGRLPRQSRHSTTSYRPMRLTTSCAQCSAPSLQ